MDLLRLAVGPHRGDDLVAVPLVGQVLRHRQVHPHQVVEAVALDVLAGPHHLGDAVDHLVLAVQVAGGDLVDQPLRDQGRRRGRRGLGHDRRRDHHRVHARHRLDRHRLRGHRLDLGRGGHHGETGQGRGGGGRVERGRPEQGGVDRHQTVTVPSTMPWGSGGRAGAGRVVVSMARSA
jgi:hypothetical protein